SECLPNFARLSPPPWRTSRGLQFAEHFEDRVKFQRGLLLRHGFVEDLAAIHALKQIGIELLEKTAWRARHCAAVFRAVAAPCDRERLFCAGDPDIEKPALLVHGALEL